MSQHGSKQKKEQIESKTSPGHKHKHCSSEVSTIFLSHEIIIVLFILFIRLLFFPACNIPNDFIQVWKSVCMISVPISMAAHHRFIIIFFY